MDLGFEAASCDSPPPNMEALDSMCEHCYGLATDCLNCASTANSHSAINAWDPWQYSDLESLPHYLGEELSIPDVKQDSSPEQYLDPLKRSQKLFQPSPTHSSQQFATRGSEELSCDDYSNSVTLEQSQEIPAYRRHKKSKAQVDLLKGWFETNPTPTGPQLAEYAKVAGLEKDQVRNWFVNQRRPGRRSKSKNAASKGGARVKRYSGEATWGFEKEEEGDATASTQPIPIPGLSHKSSLTDSLRSIPNMPESMLERWQNSSPDEEPANLSAIQNAISLSRESVRQSLPTEKKHSLRTGEINMMVVIENIPLDMTMDQIERVMLLKDVKTPRSFNYEFKEGTFRGLAFAEFVSPEDAMFAITRLNGTVLKGSTLSAYLELPLPESEKAISFRQTPEPELEDFVISSHGASPTDPDPDRMPSEQQNKPRERTYSHYSAPSTNGSASSAARSTSSSISLARRQYKERYRKPDHNQQSSSSTPDKDKPEHRFRRKRYAIPLSCAACRHRKLKCNGSHPCEHCIRRGDASSCSYVALKTWKQSRGQSETNRDDMQNRIDRLEGLVLSLMTDGALSALSVINDASSDPKFRTTGQNTKAPSPEDMQNRINRLESLVSTLMTSGAQPVGPAADLALDTSDEHHIPRQHHLCQRYYCEFCTQKFSTEEDWRQHETDIHLVDALTQLMVRSWSRPPIGDKAIWQCYICGVGVEGWEHRLDHLAMHHNLRECSCPSILSEEASSSSPPPRRRNATSSLAPPDNSVTPEQISYGFISRARAWITRRMRQL
ncbi:uncharacterized protein PAC_02425 [Phialocephala subalpina]|uniref:Uncharacterized protein n=1 Tax=Phialocephala subalpina TaxID=576137 RepID=A0A1L7WIF8_9HELO|nr:uncharacterized protein PAC_02425 [Phialocephala subalpina]